MCVQGHMYVEEHTHCMHMHTEAWSWRQGIFLDHSRFIPWGRVSWTQRLPLPSGWVSQLSPWILSLSIKYWDYRQSPSLWIPNFGPPIPEYGILMPKAEPRNMAWTFNPHHQGHRGRKAAHEISYFWKRFNLPSHQFSPCALNGYLLSQTGFPWSSHWGGKRSLRIHVLDYSWKFIHS